MANNFIFNGIVLRETDYRTGTSKSTGKLWVKRSYLFEEAGLQEYKQSFVGDIFNESAQRWLSNNIGKLVDVRFELRAREYNGRMFQDVRIADVMFEGVNVATLQSNAEKSQAQPQQQPQAQPPLREGESDELPF